MSQKTSTAYCVELRKSQTVRDRGAVGLSLGIPLDYALSTLRSDHGCQTLLRVWMDKNKRNCPQASPKYGGMGAWPPSLDSGKGPGGTILTLFGIEQIFQLRNQDPVLRRYG